MNKLLTPLLLLASTAVAAAPNAPLLTVSRVDTVRVNNQVTEKLVPVKEAVPGATYQVDIAVTVPEGLKDSKGNPIKASITFPIPKYATFSASSAKTNRAGVTVQYALKYPATAADFSEKPTKTVTVKENGKDVTKIVAAAPTEYRAVRFIYGTQTGAFLSAVRYQLN